MRKPRRPSRCPPVEKLIAFAREKRVSGSIREKVEAHLGQCARCRKEAERIGEFLGGDLAEEVAEAYWGVASLEELPIPKGFREAP